MGAWGYGLFQSDHDYDIVSDLTYEVGLDKLQSDAEARAGIADGERSDFYYTLYCPSDVKVVREYLETPNATGTSPLAKALTKWQAKASGPRTGMDYPDPGYIFVLLGACMEFVHPVIVRAKLIVLGAMTLGCNLSADTLAAMTATFTECGLMPDALVQMENALVGPLAYQGEPYFFDSPGLVETANRSSGGVVGPGGYVGMNVASPGGLFRGPDDRSVRRQPYVPSRLQ